MLDRMLLAARQFFGRPPAPVDELEVGHEMGRLDLRFHEAAPMPHGQGQAQGQGPNRGRAMQAKLRTAFVAGAGGAALGGAGYLVYLTNQKMNPKEARKRAQQEVDQHNQKAVENQQNLNDENHDFWRKNYLSSGRDRLCTDIHSEVESREDDGWNEPFAGRPRPGEGPSRPGDPLEGISRKRAQQNFAPYFTDRLSKNCQLPANTVADIAAISSMPCNSTEVAAPLHRLQMELDACAARSHGITATKGNSAGIIESSGKVGPTYEENLEGISMIGGTMGLALIGGFAAKSTWSQIQRHIRNDQRLIRITPGP